MGRPGKGGWEVHQARRWEFGFADSVLLAEPAIFLRGWRWDIEMRYREQG